VFWSVWVLVLVLGGGFEELECFECCRVVGGLGWGVSNWSLEMVIFRRKNGR